MDTPNSTTLKRCTKCGELKPRDQFHKDKNRKDGLTPHCKDCCAKKAKTWYRSNKERCIEKSKVWHDANSERYAKSHKAWMDANKKRHSDSMKAWYKANREHAVEVAKAWRKANPDKQKAGKIRYRSRKQSLPDKFTATDWQIAIDYFGGCCAACGRPPGLWHTLAADHWIPISKGGPTTPDNIIPLCHGQDGCNNSKHNKMPDEWLVWKFGKRKGREILKRIETFLDSNRQSS